MGCYGWDVESVVFFVFMWGAKAGISKVLSIRWGGKAGMSKMLYFTCSVEAGMSKVSYFTLGAKADTSYLTLRVRPACQTCPI